MTSLPDCKSLSIYLREVAAYPKLSKEETRELFLRLKTDPSARETLINCNLRLVIWQARKFANCGMPIQDLIAEGNCGLMQAMDKYDVNMATFSTYAIFWIQQKIRRAIHNQTGGIREPEHVQIARRKINNFIQTYIGKHNDRPCEETIAEETKLPLTLIRRIQKSIFQEISLDAQIGDGLPTLAETLGDERQASPAVEAESLSLAAVVQDLLAEILDERERAIIQQRHGIGGADPMTLDEVRKNFGITRERIRQIQKKAMGKLRKAMATRYRSLSNEITNDYGVDGGKEHKNAVTC